MAATGESTSQAVSVEDEGAALPLCRISAGSTYIGTSPGDLD
ncbi:hypothetical protein KGM_215330 [Danaus plexippus plexippus]|uniref:Uncharacterized protein n=1 Tax=Danaus plexippus plexippus TaxID=278856 RepID=A0A212F5E2_DANPL|nr:hypothetical protein KGM_215330 [Danaus plexippus plexippus]